MTAPETLDGWFAFHDLRTLDRSRWSGLPEGDRAKAASEASDMLTSFEDDDGEGRSITYGVIGHKADLMVIHLRPDLGQIRALDRAFDGAVLATHTRRVFSFVSVVEVSRHGAPEGTVHNIEDSPYIQARLRPEIPDYSRFVCFYPMSKKRQGDDNWYRLTNDERGELMRAHGRTGRRYAGRVAQIVTGSVGLDDWEWGVTLFADDPLLFKKLVYEMRYDEVTARYGEFGPFFVGQRLVPAELPGYLGA